MLSEEHITQWFIKYILLPGALIIDKPGFITVRYFEITGIGKFSRHIFLPEDLFVEIEKKAVKEKCEEAVYRASKIFGWRCSQLMGITTKRYEKLEKIVMPLFTFFETMYSKSLHPEIVSDHLLKLTAKDLVVCRKSGIGLTTAGGYLAGMWAYICHDPSIEVIKPFCQGRKDKECVMFVGPYEALKSLKEKNKWDCWIYQAKDVEETDYIKYKKLNEVVKLPPPSLRDLINQYFFKYSKGALTIKKFRFFPSEIGILYLLEKELKNAGKENLLFESSKKIFERIGDTFGNVNIKFVCEFLKPLGFGKIECVHKDEIIVDYYPWCRDFNENMKFDILRGALCGLLKKDVKVKNVILTDRLRIILNIC